MSNTIIPLVNWDNGTFMIGVFALVVVVLSIVVYQMVVGGSKKK